MRDKNNHRNYDADDMEAELNDREAAYEAAIENDKIVFPPSPTRSQRYDQRAMTPRSLPCSSARSCCRRTPDCSL